MPDLPVEVRHEGFLHPSERIGAQLRAQVLTEREMLEDSLPPALIADANVILSLLIGGRADLVIASAPGPIAARGSGVA